MPEQPVKACLQLEALKAKVLGERPDLMFGEFKIGYPWIIMSATFKFPGYQYVGSVCVQEESGDLTLYVAQSDKAAWDFYQRERAAWVATVLLRHRCLH